MKINIDNMNLDPSDIFECISFDISDAVLSNSKIACYMFNQEFENLEGKDKPFTPKAFPGKAIVIIIPNDEIYIEIYLDSNDYCWDSKIKYNSIYGKLSPDQMQSFFSSEFYQHMVNSLEKKWPLSDPSYEKLYQTVLNKTLRVGVIPQTELDDIDCSMYLNEIEHSHRVNQPNKRIELANKDTTGDGKRDYAGSGRRIVKFGDQGVSFKDARYFCWPRSGKEFKWNSWKDFSKIHPFCRIEFKHNSRWYVMSLTKLHTDNLNNRGFRGGDMDWKPPFAWTTPEETQEMVKLTIVQKFLRQCKKRVKKYLDMKPEDILAKIDKPENLTIKDIEKTQRVIRANIRAILNKSQIDNYKYN